MHDGGKQDWAGGGVGGDEWHDGGGVQGSLRKQGEKLTWVAHFLPR